MTDREKNKRAFEILGKKKAQELADEFDNEPLYPKAIVHERQTLIAEKGIKANHLIKDIKKKSGLSESTIKRLKKRLLGISKKMFNRKKRKP